MTGEKLNEVYYQHDQLSTGSRVIKEMHIIMSIPRNDIRSWLANTHFEKVIFYHLKK